MSTNVCLKTLLGHFHAVTCLSLSDDERMLVSGSHDKTLKVATFLIYFSFDKLIFKI